GCIASLIFYSCSVNTTINIQNKLNSYTFYPDGPLNSITLSYTNHKDTFYLSKDSLLQGWGQLFEIAFGGSILIEKELRAFLKAQTFSGVLLNLLTRILNPSQHIIWDSAFVISTPQGHGIEGIALRKKVLIPGKYNLYVVYNYQDSTTKKILFTD